MPTKTPYQRFTSSEPLGSAALQLFNQDAINKLEQYARANLVCIKCEKPIPPGDAFKMHVMPSANGVEGDMDIRIACFPCFNLEADGKTPRPDRLWIPVSGK